MTAVTTAVDGGGYLKRCTVILLLDSSVAASNEVLTRLNVRMRALWSAGLTVVKPWNGFLARTSEGNFQISDIDGIAARVDQGIRRLPKLLNILKAQKVLEIHTQKDYAMSFLEFSLLTKKKKLVVKENTFNILKKLFFYGYP